MIRELITKWCDIGIDLAIGVFITYLGYGRSTTNSAFATMFERLDRFRWVFKISGPIIVVVFTILGFVRVFQGDAGQTTMHRVQAGTRNAQGWYDAQSTEGHFSVSLPIPFNDFTFRGTETNGKETITYCIGSKSAEGFKFTVTEIPTPVKSLAELVQGAKNATDVRNFNFGGYAAIEYGISGDRSRAVMRCVDAAPTMFLLIIEYPAESEANVKPLIEPFFDSLRIHAKDSSR
jgi:hypothetical protein